MDHIRIVTEQQDDIPVIRLAGKIIGDAVPEFASALRQQIQPETSILILDMKDVELLDSTGLGVIVGCYTTLKKRGGSLVLTRLPSNVRGVLQTTQLITVFEVYPSVEAALEAHTR